MSGVHQKSVCDPWACGRRWLQVNDLRSAAWICSQLRDVSVSGRKVYL